MGYNPNLSTIIGSVPIPLDVGHVAVSLKFHVLVCAFRVIEKSEIVKIKKSTFFS